MPIDNRKPKADSRRQFILRSLGTITASALKAQSTGQRMGKAVKSLRVAKVFEYTYLVATSPDGRKIAVSRNHGSARSFSLKIIDLDTGKELGSVPLQAPPTSVSFLGSGDSLFAETHLTEDSQFTRVERVLVNLTNWNVNRRTAQYESDGRAVIYQALNRETLVGTELTRNKGVTGLVLASLQDYKETVRVPFGINNLPAPSNNFTGIAISTSAGRLIYGCSRTIICRRLGDLSLAWAHEVESEMFGIRYVSVTPNGTRVAAAVMDTMFVADQRNFYVAVFDVQTGSLVAKLHLNGADCLAISPDGKLLAVENRRMPTPGVSQPVIEIYDVDSGLQIAEAIHDSHPTTARDFGIDQIRAEFSADGKYLITSTNDTKVWALEPSLKPGLAEPRSSEKI